MRYSCVAILLTWLLAPAAFVMAEEQEPDAGELYGQTVKQFSEINTEAYTAARKADLARYVPAGKEVTVTLYYKVCKPAPAEEMEIVMLDDIHPFPVKTLDEGHAEYRQEEVKIVGNGKYVGQGAPAYPDFSKNPQAGWIAWNQWRDKSKAWAEERRKSLPPEQYQVHGRNSTVNPAGIETFDDENGRPYTPQVDMKWLKKSEDVLGAAAKSLRVQPDPKLGAAFSTLREIDSRVSGQAWSPQPGGVLLCPAAAAKVGEGLVIEHVEYDPATRQVRVTGPKSSLALDADLLATALRLAYGYKGVPYFSLDPHDPYMTDNWYVERAKVSTELTKRLNSDADFARRFNENSFEVNDDAGDRNRIVFLEKFDPELAASLDKRLPMLMELRFKPKWLARTRLGELLFLADQSIKELWHGAAIWGCQPSRTMAVEGSKAPKFWGPHQLTADDIEHATGVKYSDEGRKEFDKLQKDLSPPVSVRWWFTPGGEAKEGQRVLDLSQVQPVLQTERMELPEKMTLELGFGIKEEILINPFASKSQDPWSKAIVEDVNNRFDEYAAVVPEWQALREVFRAYVLAIWLMKHDPDAARRLLADLPPPRPPSKPLPALWEDPRLMVVRLSKFGGAELEQVTITGGIGFERPLLKATQYTGEASGGGEALGTMSSVGYVPEWADDDAPATPEGYQAWRHRLLMERGWLLAWMTALLSPSEVAFFAGLAAVLCLVTWLRAKRAKRPFTGTVAAISVLDVIMTAIVFVLVAIYPDTYKQRIGPFTGWWVAMLVYTAIFIGVDRFGRFMLTAAVMTVVMIWTTITPGLGEVLRGWMPVQLASPPLEGSDGGPLAADTVYTVQALADGLPICKAIEPHYAWYPILWLASVIGLWLEIKYLNKLDRQKKQKLKQQPPPLPKTAAVNAG